jgi:hypothetical protein
MLIGSHGTGRPGTVRGRRQRLAPLQQGVHRRQVDQIYAKRHNFGSVALTVSHAREPSYLPIVSIPM